MPKGRWEKIRKCQCFQLSAAKQAARKSAGHDDEDVEVEVEVDVDDGNEDIFAGN